MSIKLYNIRNLVAVFSPLYLSICAALLLDLKSNIKWDFSSILYFLGLISFITACYISNELYNRCNNYGRIYDIELNEFVKESEPKKNTQPKREEIYKIGEERLKQLKHKTQLFQYFGVSIFGVLGLFFIILSYLSSNTPSHKFDNQNITFKNQVDSLKVINHKQALHISDLKYTNDSILKSKNQLYNTRKHFSK